MKLDLLLDPFGARADDLKRAARSADALGYDGLWTWDHLAGSVHGERSVHECWTVLTTWAAVTERVTIGPLVLNVANRNPALSAVMAATLQDLSHGRLLLGLGAGGGLDTPYGSEQRLLDQPVGADATRRQAVRDAVATFRQAWSGRAAGVSGLLVPDPPPPVVIGGFGPRMAELAGEVGDGFNTQAGHPRLAQLAELARERYRARGATGEFVMTAFAGLDPRWYRPESAGWRRLEAAGVDRLILLVSPPYPDDALRAAAPA